MNPETRDIDMWIKETMNSWAEQGSLSPERSAQLQMNIFKLADGKKKNRFTRKVCGFVLAAITFLWVLFANCPAAAASCVAQPINTTYFPQLIIVGLISVCFFTNFIFHIANSNFEVKYE